MYEVIITGVVQGVGFRPFIYKQCTKRGLKGFIQNIGSGVRIVIDNYQLLQIILSNLPPLAKIDKITVFPYKSPEVFTQFNIRNSTGEGFSEIPPDLFLCSKCYKELHQINNRRYQYFFNTCTNCGPRYSITFKNPYDRKNTSMQQFAMCSECQKEYGEATSRRYHAQTIACPNCGPKLKLINNSQQKIIAYDIEAIAHAAKLMKQGKIIAIKGIGGFHLACNMQSKTIMKLRKITMRQHKPYAIMCQDLAMACHLATITKKEKALLISNSRPIVILKKKFPLKEVSELNTLGIMLPYTALHYLLFDYLTEPIIMTSANISGEPITTEDSQQWVDFILTHDRAIVNSIDDSVIKVIKDQPLFLRRSRGFVPQSINLGKTCTKSILAMGAEMNNTFAILKKNQIYLSPHLGDTKNWKILMNYQHTISKFLQFTQTRPEIILADLHPNYNTSLYAQTLADSWQIPMIKVQHHQAHAYSAALEHHVDDFTAIVCDGIGYGEDGAIWGGEIFHNQQRTGHLEYHYLLGGDSATKQPAKMLFSILSKILNPKELQTFLKNDLLPQQCKLLQTQLERKINCPLTSSCGRILDAASYLLHICKETDYDGRPAILLDEFATTPYKITPIIKNDILFTTPLFEFLIHNLSKDRTRLAATVLHYLSQGLYELAKQHGSPLIFTGGCAYSKHMTTFMKKQGVKVNTQVPAGDGGISLGQIGWYINQVKK